MSSPAPIIETERPPAYAPPRPGTLADVSWFALHPERNFRVARIERGLQIQHRVTTGRRTRICTFAVGGTPRDFTEAAAAAVFDRAALAWLAGLGSSPIGEGDRTWFARRPERRVRLRPAEASELVDRPHGVWVTFVFRTSRGFGRLCVDERTLGREERSAAGLARLLSVRARALALGAITDAPVSYLPSPPPRVEPVLRYSGKTPNRIVEGRRDVVQARAAIRRLTGRPEKPERTRVKPAPNAANAMPPPVARPEPTPIPAPPPAPPPVPQPAPSPAASRPEAKRRYTRRALVAHDVMVQWPSFALDRLLPALREMQRLHGNEAVPEREALRLALGAHGMSAMGNKKQTALASLLCFGLLRQTPQDGYRISVLGLAVLRGDPLARREAAETPAVYRALLKHVGRAPSYDAFAAFCRPRENRLRNFSGVWAVYCATQA